MKAIIHGFAVLLCAAFLTPSPANAQLFWLAPDFTGAPLVGYEAGMGVPLPGASPAEQRAAIAWNMRSGLNVAALQCSNEPTLRILENYNALLSDHNAELAEIFKVLTGYFKRTNKVARSADRALDSFGTKTYSGFSAVAALRGFCTASSQVARTAIFTPKGKFAEFAQNNLRTLRNSLIYKGEQQFRNISPSLRFHYPNLDERCWKKNIYNGACGLIS
ncbi:MAG: hypothetical protein AABY88_09430 [Pseudomonadota bacterium]